MTRKKKNWAKFSAGLLATLAASVTISVAFNFNADVTALVGFSLGMAYGFWGTARWQLFD